MFFDLFGESGCETSMGIDVVKCFRYNIMVRFLVAMRFVMFGNSERRTFMEIDVPDNMVRFTLCFI